MANKVLLMILDGWGKGDHKHDDAIYCAHPEYINGLMNRYPTAQLLTDGENVGLPKVRWVTRRWDTSTSVQAVWSIRIW